MKQLANFIRIVMGLKGREWVKEERKERDQKKRNYYFYIIEY